MTQSNRGLVPVYCIPKFFPGVDGRGLERGDVPGHRVPGRAPSRNDLLPLLHHPDPVRQLHPAQRLLGHRRRQLGQCPGADSGRKSSGK